MPCLERRHDRRVMGGRRYLADGLGRQVRAVGLQPESVSYWNSWLTPCCGCRPGWKRCCRRRRQPEFRSDLAPIWINNLLIGLLQLEERVSSSLPLPWGSSLMLLARRP